MLHRLCLLLLLSGVLPRLLQGATVAAGARAWRLASGATFRGVWLAEVATNAAWILADGATQAQSRAVGDFSAPDAAWLRAWHGLVREQARLGSRAPGTLRHEQLNLPTPLDLYLYVPSSQPETNRPPLLFLFQTGGSGPRVLAPFLAACEEVGLVVAASDAFHNTREVWCQEDERQLALLKALLARLDGEHRFDPHRLFLGGSDGGMMTATQFCTMLGRPCRGIYGNSGWLGGEEWEGLPYAAGLRVAVVNNEGGHVITGNWEKHDSSILRSRGCRVMSFHYKGGATSPTPAARLAALRWLLESDPAFPDATVMTSTNLPPRRQGLWALAASALQNAVNQDHHSLPGGWWAMSNAVAAARDGLAEGWGVNDRGDLLRTLRWLKNEGHRQDFEAMAEHQRRANAAQRALLNIAASLNPTISNRLAVVRQYSGELGAKGILAWDLDRYVFVCGRGYLAGYLTEEEFWWRVMPVARQLQATFSSWEELGRNHLIGRSFWSLRHQQGRGEWEAAYQNLLTNAASPWVRLPWNLPLTNTAGAVMAAHGQP